MTKQSFFPRGFEPAVEPDALRHENDWVHAQLRGQTGETRENAMAAAA